MIDSSNEAKRESDLDVKTYCLKSFSMSILFFSLRISASVVILGRFDSSSSEDDSA